MGLALPEKEQRKLLKVKIKPGCILHTFCDFIPNPKNKFVVVVHVDYDDDLLLIFLINSIVHPLIENNPILKACQLKLESNIYPFLNHDSYLNCAELFDSLEIEKVIDHLMVHRQDICGNLTEVDLLEVIQIVNSTQTIPNYDKNLIINSLGA